MQAYAACILHFVFFRWESVVRIFGLILAGGQGRRMGGVDKAHVRLGGVPLISHVRDRFEPQVEALAISANGDAARFGAALPVLADAVSQGPLSGVLAGLDWAAAAGADALVTVAVDTPFFPGDLVPQLILAGNGGLAVAQSGGRLHPTFALWPVGLRGDLRAWLAQGEARVMGFMDQHHAAICDFPVQGFDGFFNLNTPEDLAQAERLLAQ